MIIFKENEKMRALRGGYFVEHVQKKRLYHKNTLVKYGAQAILQTVFQGAAVFAATWYIGLTNANYTFDAAGLLATLAAGEPVANGYARIALAQSNVGWPTVSEVNGVMMVLSKQCNFVCTTAPWTINWTRAFLCDAAAGGAGNVIAVSGPTPAPRTVNVGAGPSIQYSHFLRG